MRLRKIVLLASMVGLLHIFTGTALGQEPPKTFPVREFWQEFEKDRQKAEKDFIGQYFNFTGVVVDTGMSIYMTPNVMLSEAPEGPIYLICVLPRTDVGTLSEYKNGDRVTMTGRVHHSKSGGGVVIKECKRVTPQ